MAKLDAEERLSRSVYMGGHLLEGRGFEEHIED
jgi:hypothetical protein